MKFEETESVEDSIDTVVEPDVVETGDGNETKPMLDYNNI